VTPLRFRLVKAVGLIALGILVLYFYLGRLSGAICASNDELRAFHFDYFVPVVYLICNSLAHWLRNQDAPFYAGGVAGLANAFLVGLLAARLAGRRAGIIACLFYLFYDLPFTFAKQLYYSTYVVFFALVAVLGLTSRRFRLPARFVAGACLALLFFTHVSSYALIAIIGLFALIQDAGRFKSDRTRSALSPIFLLGGTLSLYALLEGLLRFKARQLGLVPVSYGSWLSGFGSETASFMGAKTGVRQFALFFQTLWAHLSSTSPTNALRDVFVAMMCVVGIGVSFKKRDKNLMTLAGATASILALFALGVVVGLHPLELRHLVWLAAPVSVFFAVACLRLWKSVKTKWVLILTLLLYSFLALAKTYAVTVSLPSADPINAYFRENNIAKETVAASLPINTYTDYETGRYALSIPYLYDERNPGLSLHWKALQAGFYSGRIRYLLASASFGASGSSAEDAILLLFKPLKTWQLDPLGNPHFIFPTIRPEAGEKKFLRPPAVSLYDLAEIFRMLPLVAPRQNTAKAAQVDS